MYKLICFIVFSGKLLFPCSAQLIASREDYKQAFARLDTFLIDFYKSAQFREQADDTISFRMMQKYKSLFDSTCTHPDLINPISTQRGEPVMPSKPTQKSLDGFLNEVKVNYPRGVFMRIRALNADFKNISNGNALIICERKIWGEVKARWKIELIDTIRLNLLGLENRISIHSMEVAGFGFILTDVKQITARALRTSKPPDVDQLRRQWEREHWKNAILNKLEPIDVTKDIPDSVALDSPCAFALRAMSKGELAHLLPVNSNRLSPTVRKQPMVAFSDRFGTSSLEAPNSQSEEFRSIPFLKPFIVVDTSSEFVHIVEYVFGATSSNKGRINKCLEDYGWVRSSRLVFGAECLYDSLSLEPIKVAGRSKSKVKLNHTNNDRFFYQNPNLSNERLDSPLESNILYIYKKQGDAVLVGRRENCTGVDVERVMLGWVKLSDILKGLNYE
jgi:hypothetical protein